MHDGRWPFVLSSPAAFVYVLAEFAMRYATLVSARAFIIALGSLRQGAVERCGSPDLDAIDTARPIMRALGPRRLSRFVLSFEPPLVSQQILPNLSSFGRGLGPRACGSENIKANHAKPRRAFSPSRRVPSARRRA